LDVIEAEVGANGWGNENSDDAGRIAVCESWAEHIGMTYAHRSYFTNTSIGETFEARTERRVNAKPNHVPWGLHHDLLDGVVDPPTRVVDHVSGFTNAQLFNTLNNTVINPEQYRSRLIQLHLGSTSNTEQQVNDLFNSY